MRGILRRRLQHNIARIKSSTADVSQNVVKNRDCFLCLDHLPEEQKGILYQTDYLILANPIPVFPSHFTVSHIDHRLQTIDEHIQTFLQLMADLGPSWTVLYNGPKCGASAPDHLHFQVGPSGQMPIEKEIRAEKKIALIRKIDGVLLCCARDLGREVSGEAEITVEQKATKLDEKQSLRFNSNLDHHLSNPGEREAELLVILYLPY